MSIAIRLKRTGTKSRKQWRIVALDKQAPRDGRLLEELGSYNPLTEPPEVRLQMERYHVWIQKGARPSRTVAGIVKKLKK